MYDCCRVETAIIHNERKKTCNIAGVQLDTVQAAVDRDEGCFRLFVWSRFFTFIFGKKNRLQTKAPGPPTT